MFGYGVNRKNETPSRGSLRAKCMVLMISSRVSVGNPRMNEPYSLMPFLCINAEPCSTCSRVIFLSSMFSKRGVAVSIPIYYATGSKKKAFWLSFLSGLADPVGAIVVWLILMPFMSAQMMGVIFSLIAGIMVFISLDELLPAAEEYGEHHIAVYGLIGGMVIMAISLLLLT